MKQPFVILIITACALLSAAVVYAVFAGTIKERARIRLAHAQQVSRVVKETNKADADYLQGISRRGMFDLGSPQFKARRDYVDSLRKVSLAGCPSDFSNAWTAYVGAWESSLNDVPGRGKGLDLKEAWREVEITAGRYGIDASR